MRLVEEMSTVVIYTLIFITGVFTVVFFLNSSTILSYFGQKMQEQKVNVFYSYSDDMVVKEDISVSDVVSEVMSYDQGVQITINGTTLSEEFLNTLRVSDASLLNRQVGLSGSYKKEYSIDQAGKIKQVHYTKTS